MLVVSRQLDEEIVVDCGGGRIVVFKIVDIRSDKVRVGMKAPKDVGLYRRELWEEKLREEAEARRAAEALRLAQAG